VTQTLDPNTFPSIGSFIDDEVQFLEVLFHPDLRRIGDRCTLGSTARDGVEMVVGRARPDFSGPGGAEALGDPCVSRSQLSVQWIRSLRAFRVRSMPESRRPLRLLTLDGQPFVGDPGVAPPGSVLAIGDRILLLLGCGRLRHGGDDGAMIGASSEMAELRRKVRAIAQGSDSVLVRGETGVGKELVARAIHAESPRRNRAFLAVNCAALPEHLVESELFGYARGAFSGATSAKEGLFRAADGGTLFLDELGELPLPFQAKLLRVLQEKALRPVGETRESPVDVRIVAATNRDLEADVAAGRFRADLYSRLEAPSVTVPPLRDRRADVPALFTHFLRRKAEEEAGQGSPLAQLWRPADAHSPPIKMSFFVDLLRHDWPRNVRELEKYAASCAIAVREHGRFTPPPLVSSVRTQPPPAASATPAVEERGAAAPAKGRPSEEELLRHLDAHDYVQNRVASALGISRTTLDKWMRELKIRRPKDVPRDEIEAARVAAAGSVPEMARALHVSVRGLKLRMNELGFGVEEP
jgi:two-component system nitrogen regulation response regulator GlnG